MKYFDRLFRPYESINVCYVNVKEIKSKPLEIVKSQRAPRWACVNPLKKGTTRATKNISEFRNFVIEFDDIPIEHQTTLVSRMGLPFSTAVYSGNKSIHFVIALTEAVTQGKYAELATHLKYAVRNCDKACLEPARLTRCPHDDQPQLIDYGPVEIAELEAWLAKYPMPRQRVYKGDIKTRQVTHRAGRFFAGLSEASEAHHDSLHAVKNLQDMGLDQAQAIEVMYNTRRIYMEDEPKNVTMEKAKVIVEWVYNEWN